MSNIKRIIKQINRKIRHQGSKGFSFAEMLFAVLILLLASQLIAESMRLAAAHYKNYTNKAHAQMIMSTLSDFVRSELTTASEIDNGSDGITFFDGSGIIGGRCKLVDGASIYLQNVKDPNIKYYPIVGTEGGTVHDYAEELEIVSELEMDPEATASESEWTFNLSIEVKDKKGTSLATGKYEITVPGEVKED